MRVEIEIAESGHLRPLAWNWLERPLGTVWGGHLRPLAATCDHGNCLGRPLAATCGHSLGAATCGHLRPLAWSGHLQPLAATRVAASCKWLRVAASGCEWLLVVARGCEWLPVLRVAASSCKLPERYEI